MPSEFRPSLLLRILLPLAFLLLVPVAPLPHRYVADLREARQAQADGQPGVAAARLASALRQQPGRVDLWEPLGMQSLLAGREDAALEALNAAQAAGALSVEGQFTLGELYALRGEDGLALETWKELAARPGVEGSPLAARVWERIYRLERARRDWAAAVAALRAWRSAEPERARPGYLLGLHLCAADPEKALPLLIEAAERDAQFAAPVRALRWGLAQFAAADDPGYGWVMVGRALGSLDEWDLALLPFQKATELSPAYAEAWAFLAEARYQNRLDPAAALQTAQDLNPRSPLVRAVAALHLRRAGRPDLAVEYLAAIAAQEPEEPAWQVELGRALAESGDLIAARAAFERAHALDPQSVTVLKALVTFSTQYSVDLRDLGLPAARQLVGLAPDDPEALDLMGQVFLHLEDARSAERFLQRSLAKQSGYAPAHLHLGQLYLQENDPARAREFLRKAEALAPESPVGAVARRLLRRYFNEGGPPGGS